MSDNVTIRPEQLADVLNKALAKYGDKVLDDVEAVTKSVTRQATSELKSRSPVGAKGSYARGWSHKAQRGGAYKVSETVYNRTDPQLTHLLEKPHDTGGGGHYPKNKDHTGIIADIEEEYTNKFMEEVLAKL